MGRQSLPARWTQNQLKRARILRLRRDYAYTSAELGQRTDTDTVSWCSAVGSSSPLGWQRGSSAVRTSRCRRSWEMKTQPLQLLHFQLFPLFPVNLLSRSEIIIIQSLGVFATLHFSTLCTCNALFLSPINFCPFCCVSTKAPPYFLRRALPGACYGNLSPVVNGGSPSSLSNLNIINSSFYSYVSSGWAVSPVKSKNKPEPRAPPE